MFKQILSSAGGSLGGALGGGIFSGLGRFAGGMLGSYLDRLDYEPEEFYQFRNIRDSFTLTKANPGDPIPLVFGSVKVPGKIIWATQVKEVQNTDIEKKYFTDTHQLRAIYHQIECEYYLSFALALCEGEILEVNRVWAGNELVNLGSYKFRLYTGSETQEVDPLIAANSTGGKAPAFRGLTYIVFEDLPLDGFGGTIPNFYFEVTRRANINIAGTVEDLVKSIVMIPGSGEFVYDTLIQHKVVKNHLGAIVDKETINSHNHRNKANSLYSLDQLQMTCPNTEWVAVVACWFGDSTDASTCSIMPGVEYVDKFAETTEEWRVGNFTRTTARLISRDHNDSPRYGGSVNDASLVRYLAELKARGLKVMFYPMIFLDVPNKPWRGHLTGDCESVRTFFTKKHGYNEFILHYAELVKDYADAFVIGSELIGLTKVKSDGNFFPAVNELMRLAALVKGIVGENTAVTYAADWSEYHHTEGGWYNLDDLWSSPSIDFVGIDAYFPVTSSVKSSILSEEIIKGWQSGDGYDYYLDHNGAKQPLEPAYAWKNLSYWWENTHRNPDGCLTGWEPKMKKIWFTEFGFPSIDKATNQPNVFFDPFCIDGGVPRHSTGDVDFSIQRRAIKVFIEYWEAKEFIGRMFLWTWDARPYPAWPHMDIWRDGYLWEKGHWVNNKFGAASVASIILELSDKCGIDLAKVDVSHLDESVEGITFMGGLSAFDAINILRITHFFDITATAKEQIRFVKRQPAGIGSVNNRHLVKLSENSYLLTSEISKDDIMSKVCIHFLDHTNEYKAGYHLINNEVSANRPEVVIKLPLVMSGTEAGRFGALILQNALIENRLITFSLPATALQLEPADFVELHYLGTKILLRIIYIKVGGIEMEITGIVDDAESYYLPQIKTNQQLNFNRPDDVKFIILDLPPIFNLGTGQPQLTGYLRAGAKMTLEASIFGNSYSKVTHLLPGAIIGRLAESYSVDGANILVIDELSRFIIYCNEIDLSKLGRQNRALLGDEFLSFQQLKKVGTNLYEISSLIRGEFATEKQINNHKIGEDFILLDIAPNVISVSDKLTSQSVNFRVGEQIQNNFTFMNHLFLPLPPFITSHNVADNRLSLSWIARTNITEDWLLPPPDILHSFIIEIGDEKFHTEKTQFTIELSTLGISGRLEIDIISQDREGRKSNPTTVSISV